MVILGLADLFRFAAKHGLFINFSNLYIAKGSIVDKTGCIKSLSDISDDKLSYAWEILSELPSRLKAENPSTDIWEIGPFYEKVKNRTERISYDRFVPSLDETIYLSYKEASNSSAELHLRKFYIKFDDCFKGIYISKKQSLQINLPYETGKITYRYILCNKRDDGNFLITPCDIREVFVGKELEINTYDLLNDYNAVMFQVLDYKQAELTMDEKTILFAAECNALEYKYFIWENILLHHVDSIIREIVDSKKPVVIWCAGARTSMLFANTCLCKANIKMIIDSDKNMHGKFIYGYRTESPDELIDSNAIILLINATKPYVVELAIRKRGIKNPIYIL